MTARKGTKTMKTMYLPIQNVPDGAGLWQSISGNFPCFTGNGVSSFPRAHKVEGGGIPMTVKHTHPQYETAEKRQEALRDTRRVCAELLRSLRSRQARQIS